MASSTNTIRFAFFGTPDRAVLTLNILKERGLLPELIITQPDRPVGRKMEIIPPPVKEWALRENIPVIQPEKMSDEQCIQTLAQKGFDVFIVVAYGNIIPERILKLAKHGALNLHGSLLPKLRGASPIETAILNDDKDTGASILLMDEKMDHGPVVAERKLTEVQLKNWPLPADELARHIVTEGSTLLADILPDFIQGKIQPKEQDHSKATYTHKIKKEDGLVNLTDDPYKNYLKYQAYKIWPGTFFFIEKNGKQTRIKITEAVLENNSFVIKKVIPEGKNEISYESFLKQK